MLASCGVQTLPEFLLIARPGADNYYGDIGGFCCSDGLWELRLVVRPSLAAFSIGNAASGGVSDALEGSHALVLRPVHNVITVLEVKTLATQDLVVCTIQSLRS